MVDFRDMTLIELENYIESIGEKKFRAKQIYSWIHKGIENFDDMSNLPIATRILLKDKGYISNMNIVEKLISKIDGTTKYLMKLCDDNVIECVLMKYKFGNSICISTQVGCSMACSFCASGINGKVRNLTSGEMLGQILKVQSDSEVNISNIVLMGTGEPLDNFENVLKFLSLVNEKNGINIGMRHITISTCGLVPKIKDLADLNHQITLAISLHAPNNEIRKKIMPVSNKYSYEELLDACKYYILKTNRRITFEYALINGVNDDLKHAEELAAKLKALLCHVNLIPINKVDEKSFTKSNIKKIEAFKEVLNTRGIETTIRRELGSDINAACGQLRRRYIKSNEYER